MRQRRAEREASDAETAASGARRRVTEERRQSVLRREFAASEQKAAGDAQRHAASSVGAFESAREHEEEHTITAAVEAIRGEGRGGAALGPAAHRPDERTAVWVDGRGAAEGVAVGVERPAHPVRWRVVGGGARLALPPSLARRAGGAIRCDRLGCLRRDAARAARGRVGLSAASASSTRRAGGAAASGRCARRPMSRD